MSHLSAKPKDLARCTRCRRLVRKDTITAFNGGFYGPECLQKALDDARTDPLAEWSEEARA